MEDILSKGLEIENNIESNLEQKNFLETTIGKTINTGIDI